MAVPASIASLHAGDFSIPIAVTLVALMAAMYAYTFSLLGKVCAHTGASTYTEAWEKTMGKETAPIASTILSMKTTMACVAYSMILADSAQSFTHLSRLDSLLGVTLFGLLPLCLLPDLTSLAPFCLAGVVCFVLTAAAMLVRLLDGSYSAIPPPIVDALTAVEGPDVFNEPAVASVLQESSSIVVPTGHSEFDVLQIVGMACTLAGAFVAHYNAPRLYSELSTKKVSSASSTQEDDFSQITTVAFGISALLTAFVGIVGFETFGSGSAPIVLANYASNDALMRMCQCLITLSLVFTFPLPFVGLRDSLKDQYSTIDDRTLSLVLLTAITTAAASCNDLALFLQVGGGTVSTAVAAVLPTLMYQNMTATATTKKDRSLKGGAGSSFRSFIPDAVMYASIAVGTTGVSQALYHAWSG